ncbi:MAG: hypothetical protein WA702_28895 [Bradyrhizobium sp.]|jgi:hypothetical protein
MISVISVDEATTLNRACCRVAAGPAEFGYLGNPGTLVNEA